MGKIWANYKIGIYFRFYTFNKDKARHLLSSPGPLQAQCLLTSPASHELFIAAEIRNYVKEAARKSLWLGIVNQSIPRGGDNATVHEVETAP